MGSPVRLRRIPWHLILIFSLLSLGILGLGYSYFDYQRAYLKQEKLNEVAAIADLKTRQLVDWRKERLADAHMIMEDRFFAAWVRDWLEGENKGGLKNEIFNRLKSLLVYQYQNIVLLDLQGKVRLSVLGEEEPLDAVTKTLAMETIQTKKVVFSDLYRSEGSQAVRLSILVPILFSQGTEEVCLGAILIRVDPHEFLYPLIQSWPTPSRSAEIVLLRREGNELVILNELRNRKGSALSLRYSIQEANLPAAMAVKGKEGAVAGLDYRGVPVLAVVGGIPGSPWHFVAKIDAAEVYAPLRERLHLVLFLLIVLIIGTGVSLASVWSHQQARFYRRQYEMEQEREKVRQQAEVEIRKQAALLDLAHDAIFVRDLDSMLVYWSHGAEETYGFTKEQALGRIAHELLRTKFPIPREEVEKEVLAKGHWHGELIHTRADGGVIVVASRWAVQRDDEGEPVAFLEINRDITERREAEEEIKTLNAELEQRVKERTAELEFANRELESFSYSVSHDLKTPIRAIQGFSRMLVAEHGAQLDGEGHRLLKVITDNTKLMHALVDDLLALSRLSRQEIKKRSVDLSPIAKQVFDQLRDQSPGRDIQFTIGDLPLGQGDQSLLYLVMENLLANAIKFTQVRKTAIIEVDGRDEGDETIYCVKDNGVGFDERYAEKLYGVFQRLVKPEEYEGTGVGLAIVKRIIERHGGRVWAEGQAGQGATFYFALPKAGKKRNPSPPGV